MVDEAVTYDDLKRRALHPQAEGALHRKLTPEERADWAYGDAAVENDLVTREMAERAVAAHVDDE